MRKFLWIITIVFSIISALIFIATIILSKGAPQEASGSAISLCIAVIPYILARAVSELKK